MTDLNTLSARLGHDPMLVQGAGGNTSTKADGVMHVKASGFQLGQALDSDIFVAVDLASCLEKIGRGEGDKLADCALPVTEGPVLRPSIETALHALMPHACVAHVHSLQTLAASIQPHTRAALGDALDGLRWCLVPYAKPGAPLAEAVMSGLKANPADVVIMQNHGLVVGAGTPEAAGDMIDEVEARLATLFDADPMSDAEWAGKGHVDAAKTAGFKRPGPDIIQSLALAGRLHPSVWGYSLFPDQTVFLGPGLAIAEPGQTAAEAAHLATEMRQAEVYTVVFPGEGVVLSEKAHASGAEPNLEALARVSLLLDHSRDVSHLDRKAEHELVNWDAEAYRRNLKLKS